MSDIREIRIQDFPVLQQLLQEFAEFEGHADLMTNSIARMEAEKEHIRGFLAFADGKAVGFTTFFFAYHSWTGKCLHMDDLYVQPDFRGRGLGKALLDKVIETAKQDGCHKLGWQVSNWNENAQNFYRRMGAEITDEQWNCILDLTASN